MTEKLDRRKRRTRALLAEALIQLIMERGFENISITDIAETADLNRATFYLHYKNKEELLIKMLEARFDQLVVKINELNGAGIFSWQTYAAEKIVFEHVAEHADMYKVLLGPNAVGYVINRVIKYIAIVVESEIRQEFTDEMVLAPIPIVAQHVAGALFAQICWWLEHDMPYTADHMARLTHEMCRVGTTKLLGEEVGDFSVLTP